MPTASFPIKQHPRPEYFISWYSSDSVLVHGRPLTEWAVLDTREECVGESAGARSQHNHCACFSLEEKGFVFY